MNHIEKAQELASQLNDRTAIPNDGSIKYSILLGHDGSEEFHRSFVQNPDGEEFDDIPLKAYFYAELIKGEMDYCFQLATCALHYGIDNDAVVEQFEEMMPYNKLVNDLMKYGIFTLVGIERMKEEYDQLSIGEQAKRVLGNFRFDGALAEARLVQMLEMQGTPCPEDIFDHIKVYAFETKFRSVIVNAQTSLWVCVKDADCAAYDPKNIYQQKCGDAIVSLKLKTDSMLSMTVALLPFMGWYWGVEPMQIWRSAKNKKVADTRAITSDTATIISQAIEQAQKTLAAKQENESQSAHQTPPAEQRERHPRSERHLRPEPKKKGFFSRLMQNPDKQN